MKLLITPLIESELVILTADGQEPEFRHYEGYCKTCVRSPQQFLQEYSYGSAVEIGIVYLTGSHATDEALSRDMRLRLSPDGVMIHVGKLSHTYFKVTDASHSIVIADIEKTRLVYELPRQIRITRGLRDFPQCDGSRWIQSATKQLESVASWTTARTVSIQADGLGLTSRGLPKSIVNRIDRVAQQS